MTKRVYILKEKKMSEVIKLPVILTNTTRKVDNSLSLRVVTTLESSEEERQQLDRMFQRELWMILAEGDSDMSVEIPLEAPKFSEARKSPASRLYNVLAVYYKQHEDTLKAKYPVFRLYYEMTVERMIEEIKEKLL